jgi:hypothetical protein
MATKRHEWRDFMVATLDNLIVVIEGEAGEEAGEDAGEEAPSPALYFGWTPTRGIDAFGPDIAARSDVELSIAIERARFAGFQWITVTNDSRDNIGFRYCLALDVCTPSALRSLVASPRPATEMSHAQGPGSVWGTVDVNDNLAADGAGAIEVEQDIAEPPVVGTTYWSIDFLHALEARDSLARAIDAWLATTQDRIAVMPPGRRDSVLPLLTIAPALGRELALEMLRDLIRDTPEHAVIHAGGSVVILPTRTGPEPQVDALAPSVTCTQFSVSLRELRERAKDPGGLALWLGNHQRDGFGEVVVGQEFTRDGVSRLSPLRTVGLSDVPAAVKTLQWTLNTERDAVVCAPPMS